MHRTNISCVLQKMSSTNSCARSLHFSELSEKNGRNDCGCQSISILAMDPSEIGIDHDQPNQYKLVWIGRPFSSALSSLALSFVCPL